MSTQKILPPFNIRRCSVNQIIGLRQRILRPNMPLKKARFPKDTKGETFHVGIFTTDGTEQVICCASFMAERLAKEVAWKMRGMATATEYEHRGLGRKLLEWSENAIRLKSESRLLWCNARLSAIGFYRKMGWDIVSLQFNIPGVGPHHRMMKRL